MKARAYLEQTGHSTAHLQPAVRGSRNATQDLEQRALPGSIAPDDPDHVAGLHAERDIAQGPHHARVIAVGEIVESAQARRTVRSCARSSPRSSRYSLDTRSTEICVTTGVLSDDVGHHVLDVAEVPE